MDIVFDESTGLLIPGEHKLALVDFEKTFVYNDRRRKIYSGFLKLIDIFNQIGCTHIYADGSYVTQKPHPGDIDVCWHMHEEKEKRDKQLKQLFALCRPLIFLNKKVNRAYVQHEFSADVFPANSTEGLSGLMFKDFFQKDKHTNTQKGIIVIDLI